MSAHNPANSIIDRYLPDASPEEKREAEERLDRYVRILFRIAVRLYEKEQADSLESLGGDTLSL